jgi:hypothetical protein
MIPGGAFSGKTPRAFLGTDAISDERGNADTAGNVDKL